MYSLVYITTPTSEEAGGIARELVGGRLAACANVLPTMTSYYRWEGDVQEDLESVLILKTRTALVPALIRRVKELHSYSCPCVVALPITDGEPTYLEWISTEARPTGA